jgi:D-amino-acid dehydrogenase
MDIAGAVHFADDCHLNPSRLMSALANRVRRLGGEIRWGAEVRGIQAANGRIYSVRTNSKEVRADEFVIAGGAWSGSIVRDLGLRLPMLAGKGYSMTLPNPRQLPNLCSILVEARVAVTPMGESLRFAGTMELGGLDMSINQTRVNGIRKSIPKYFPDFHADDFRGAPVWSGLRPCSPDGLPYIGRFSRFPNLSVATGHAMMGVSLAPVTGQLISEIISEPRPQSPLHSSLVSPDRFT